MVDVKRRENDMLEAIGALVERRELALLQIRLNEYAYPELMPVWSDLRACLKGADE